MTQLGDCLGKYHIERILGQGAMGTVYLANDPVIERSVAIKVLHPHHCQGPNGEELSQRFRREAQAAARCLHPNIVTVFDYGTHNGLDYLVMEYVEGEELCEILSHDDKLTIDEVKFITLSVLRGLHGAHQHKIIHRDIKPANIILLNNGEVKIADFGVALLEQSDLTLVGHMVGTPNYMSPEGLRGETVTLQADLYSCAMVMLEMLTGAKLNPQQLYTLPIANFLDDVFSKHTQLSIPIQSLLRKALAGETKDRHKNALEFIDDIENLETDKTPKTAPPETLITVIKESAKLKISDSKLQEVEKSLSNYLGPIANLVIKKTITSSQSPEQFMMSLAAHIPDSNEKSQFINNTRSTLSISNTATAGYELDDSQTVIKPSLSDQVVSEEQKQAFEPISAAQLDLITNELMYFLGPIAKHQVKRHVKRYADKASLCANLAVLISNPDDQKSFISKTKD